MSDFLDLTDQFVREYRELEAARGGPPVAAGPVAPPPDLVEALEASRGESARLREAAEALSREVGDLRARCAGLEAKAQGAPDDPLRRELDLYKFELEQARGLLEAEKSRAFDLRRQLFDCQSKLYGS